MPIRTRDQAIRTAFESGYISALDEIADLIRNGATVEQLTEHIRKNIKC